MAEKDIEVKASAKTVSSDKTKKQDAELEKSKKRKEEADRKAEEAVKEAEKKKIEEEKRKEEEKKKKEEEKQKAEAAARKEKEATADKVIAGAATVATAVLAGNRKKGFFSGLIIGTIIGFLIATMIGFSMKETLFGKIETAKEDFDDVITETFMGYTAADFKEVILGEATQHQELIVMEQPLQVATTITKAGIGNLQIFSKVKNVIFAGTGVYTVDLSHIDDEHINVNEEDHEVVISVPHAVLQYVNPDYDSMEFEDTEKGFLAFGDLSLTLEQQNKLEKSVQEAMRERLEEQDLYDKADSFARMMIWDIFQPLVTSVSPEFKVSIEFVD